MANGIRARASWVASAAVVAILVVPAAARADGLIMPFVGADFGGDAGDCRGVTPCWSKQLTYGVGFGFMVGGVIGLQRDRARAALLWGRGRPRGNDVLSGMVNILVGVPIGPVRPYVVGGIGVLHTDINQSTTGLDNAVPNNSLAFDVGGGLIGMFSQHVGVRGDLR